MKGKKELNPVSGTLMPSRNSNLFENEFTQKMLLDLNSEVLKLFGRSILIIGFLATAEIVVNRCSPNLCRNKVLREFKVKNTC